MKKMVFLAWLLLLGVSANAQTTKPDYMRFAVKVNPFHLLAYSKPSFNVGIEYFIRPKWSIQAEYNYPINSLRSILRVFGDVKPISKYHTVRLEGRYFYAENKKKR